MSSKVQHVIASAPGKVILHGEYAVVFEKKAIAVSVDLRTTVKVSTNDRDDKVKLSLKNFSSSHTWTIDVLKSTSFAGVASNDPPDLQLNCLADITPSGLESGAEQAVKAFLYLYLGLAMRSTEWPAIDVQVESQFPSGAGLGSSAAFSVSLAAALIKVMTGSTPDNQTVSNWAFQCEHIFHGKPSGIDNSICSFGGAVLFQAGKVVEALSDVKKLPALLVYTNVTRNTKVLVESVTRRRERVGELILFLHLFPAVILGIMNAIDEISDSSWSLMKSGKYEGEDKNVLVTMNQHLVNALGAGHESIEKVLNIAHSRGLTGKLTGAGGGGCVIIHLSEETLEREVQDLKDELTANHFQHWVLSFGGAGVILESD